MDNNASPHRALLFEDCHEGHSLEQMEWIIRSPDDDHNMFGITLADTLLL